MAEYIESEVKHCIVIKNGTLSILAARAAPVNTVSKAFQKEGFERAACRPRSSEDNPQWSHGTAKVVFTN